jgi:hypothetical protein
MPHTDCDGREHLFVWSGNPPDFTLGDDLPDLEAKFSRQIREIGDSLLSLQGERRDAFEIRAAATTAVLQRRALHVAGELLNPSHCSDLVLPTFLIQLAAAIERSGDVSASVRIVDALELPWRMIVVLGAFAVDAVVEVLHETPRGARPNIDIALLHIGSGLELCVRDRHERRDRRLDPQTRTVAALPSRLVERHRRWSLH